MDALDGRFVLLALYVASSSSFDVQYVANASCLNNCSSNGVCNNARCDCDSGFQGPDCSVPCGIFGQSCCCQRRCLEGSCVAYDGKPDGVCTSFGGSYMTDAAGHACLQANFYVGNCSCPHGFNQSCFAVSAGLLCACDNGIGGDWGGVFETDTTSCLSPNGLTGQCSCLEGTKPLGPLSSYVGGQQGAVYFCYPPSAFFAASSIVDGPASPSSPPPPPPTAVVMFAGAFETGAADGLCLAANPLTNDCTCPSPPSGLTVCTSSFGIAASATEAADLQVCALAHQNPALLASVSQAGIYDLLRSVIIYIINKTQSISLPDISGSGYSVSGIHFSRLVFASVDVTFPQPGVLAVSMAGGELDGTISRIHVSKDGISEDCNADPFDVSAISVDFQMSLEVPFLAGRPQLQFGADCHAVCGSVDVSVHGGTVCGWLSGDIESAIRGAVQSQFPSSLSQEVASTFLKEADSLAANISRASFLVPLRGLLPHRNASQPPSPLADFALDLSVAGCGTVLQSDPALPLLQLPLRGSFLALNGTQPFLEVPSTVGPFGFPQAPPLATKELQLCLSPYVLDAVGWALYANDALPPLIITADMLPKSLPVGLNTSDPLVELLAPGLRQVYAGDLAMQLSVRYGASAPGSVPPSSTVFAAGLAVDLAASVTFQVLSPNDTQPDACTAAPSNTTDSRPPLFVCDAFTLAGSFSANFSLTISENATFVRFEPGLVYVSLAWSAVASNVGEVHVSYLNDISLLVDYELLKLANAKLHSSDLLLAKTQLHDMLVLHNVTQPLFMLQSDPLASYVCLEANLTFACGDHCDLP